MKNQYSRKAVIDYRYFVIKNIEWKDRRMTRPMNVIKTVLLTSIFVIALTHHMAVAQSGKPGLADTLPPGGWQKVEWQNPGNWQRVDMTRHGCKPNEPGIDAAAKVRDVLAKARGNVILYFPPGKYYLNTDLEIRRSNVGIAGAGYKKTELIINTKAKQNGEVAFIGGKVGEPINVSGKPNRGDSVIRAASVAGLKRGNFVQIFNADGPQAWGYPQESQIVRILGIRGNHLKLDMKLGLDFDQKPQIRKIDMVKNVGIQDVHVRRVRAANKKETSNIHFKRAFNGFARDCMSSWLERGGVHANMSRNIIVERCLVHHAFDYGGGGQGYGILFNVGSTNCRATNNKLWTLRHHIQLSIGANHCVISYNSSEPKYKSGQDTHVHGFFVHNSLFEGNTGRELGSDQRGGRAGLHIAFFRNRFNTIRGTTKKKGAGYFLFAGNVSKRNSISPKLQNVVQIGNSWNQDKPQETRLPPSLYLNRRPDFLEGVSWPVFGPGASGDRGDENKLPAARRAKPSK